MDSKSEEATKPSDQRIVYGELSILGYNGYIPNKNGRQNKSKMLLHKRPEPNGIKKSRHYIVKHPQATKATEDKEVHSISYTFSRSQTIVVEYRQDNETDLFQIGRSSEEPIDFVVLDTMIANENQTKSSSRPHQCQNINNSGNCNNNNISSGRNNYNINNCTSNNSNPSDHNENYVHILNNQYNQLQHHIRQYNHFHQPQPYQASINQIQYQPEQHHRNHHHHHHHHHHQHNHHHHHQRPHKLEAPSGNNANVGNSHPTQSTISRFACRILVDREPPHNARIYAAGFDSSKNIFLGEKATKWEENDSFDGLTTNGVLMTLNGVWREVSVDGGIYAIRESRSASKKGSRIEGENNLLQDGALIDLCGATILWRSREGFMSSPTKRTLEEKIDLLNASRPQCPVGLNTLIIPRKPILAYQQQEANKNGKSKDSSPNHSHHHNQQQLQLQHNHHSQHHSHRQQSSPEIASENEPYVYLKCGHVQGYHDWGVTGKSNQRTCPICLSVGNVAKLTMGIEPSFYVDSGPLTHVFNPCGHMASEATVKYWCTVKVPYGTHFFHSICPFCATPVETRGEPSTRLIFQDDLD